MSERLPFGQAHEVERAVSRPVSRSVGRPVSEASTRDRCGAAGSVTTFTVGLMAMLTTVVLVASAIGGVLIARRSAMAAADLAALAGASAQQQLGNACAAASTVAGRNGASLRSCDVNGDVVEVRTAREIDSLFGWRFTLEGQARAGPAQ